MIKAFFIAPTKQQATFWANVWGYRRGEWKFINNREVTAIQGYFNPKMPAFTCGTEGPGSRMWLALKMRGFTVYDAQDIETGPIPSELFKVCS